MKTYTPKPNRLSPWRDSLGRTNVIRLCFAMAFILTSLIAQAQYEPPRVSFLDQLIEQEVQVIELKTDLDSLLINRKKYRYQKAEMNLSFADGTSKAVELKVRPRGRFRNRFSEVPPLKIKLSKTSLKQEGLVSMNELKLVLPLKNGNQQATWVHKEYLAYKLYEKLTPYSFRTQLVEVVLRDTPKRKRSIRLKAFLIEDKEEVASRLALEQCRQSYQGAELSPYHYQIVQLFQFMIGNTDWLPTTSHNIAFFRSSTQEVIPIPFDFDFSGLVSTSYAWPSDRMPISNVKERYFMGNYLSLQELKPAIQHFQTKKAELLQVIQDFTGLPKSEKRQMIKYLLSFFDLISNDTMAKDQFVHLMEGPRGEHY
ncbi:MAG: hypothetical protein KTR30_22010 [Saprospiraceae bacterium]|nr:hypothetical protein [Saprospiraceae bacterium]